MRTTDCFNPRNNNARYKRLLRSASKYRLRILEFTGRYDATTEQYIYTVRLARKGSGTRGARHLRNHRHVYLINLQPIQRLSVARIGWHEMSTQGVEARRNTVSHPDF